MKPISLAFITDDRYSLPTGVAIQSAIQSKNKETIYDISIILNNVSQENQLRFKKLQTEMVLIHLIEFDPKNLDQFQVPGYYVSPTGLLKFNLPELLPNKDKVLYLDGDVLIQDDLSKLYNTPLYQTYVAGVRDMTGEVIVGLHKRLNLNHYMNSGVMLLNLSLMRQKKMTEKLYQVKQAHPEYCCMDQDVFNDVFRDNITWLPLTDNLMFSNMMDTKTTLKQVNQFYQTAYRSYDDIIQNTCIIHLTNERKPWLYRYTYFSKEWQSIYLKSPFSDIALKYKDNWNWYVHDIPVFDLDRLMNQVIFKILGVRIFEYKKTPERQKFRLFHLTFFERIKRKDKHAIYILKIPVLKSKRNTKEVRKKFLGLPLYRREKKQDGCYTYLFGFCINHKKGETNFHGDQNCMTQIENTLIHYLNLNEQFHKLDILNLMKQVPQNPLDQERIIRHIDDPAPFDVEYLPSYQHILRYMSFSQMGQDRCASFILSYFCHRDLSDIHYLDIGAAEPIGDSNTYLFYCMGGHGVLVDPNTRLITPAYSLRPRDVVIEGGIAFDEKQEADYYDFGVVGQGHNTFDPENAQGSSKIFKLISVTPKKLYPINEILEVHFKNKAPDFVSIDAEGVDFKIIQTLDFDRWRPILFCIENKTKELVAYMKQKNYRLIAASGADHFFVDEGSLKQ